MNLGLFIDGEFRPAAKGGTFSSINPATEEPWAEIASATSEDVERAVKAARRSFAEGVWRKKSREERSAVLAKIASTILERSDELALAEVKDAGGTIRKANMADVPATAQTFQYYADLLMQTPDEEVFTEEV